MVADRWRQGLHASEWYALSRIRLAGGLTSGELSAGTGLTTGATTRLIDCLERAGHVRRTTDPADRPKVLVEAILDALGEVEAAVAAARPPRIGEVLADCTPEQQDLLFDYFARSAPAFLSATEEIRTATREHREADLPSRSGGATDRLPDGVFTAHHSSQARPEGSYPRRPSSGSRRCRRPPW